MKNDRSRFEGGRFFGFGLGNHFYNNSIELAMLLCFLLYLPHQNETEM